MIVEVIGALAAVIMVYFVWKETKKGNVIDKELDEKVERLERLLKGMQHLLDSARKKE